MGSFTATSLPQSTETHVQRVRRQHYTFRLGYARSADSRASGEPGQDYLALREDGERIAFALCDGVSQSFFGNLAAQFLGNALVDGLLAGFSAFRNESDLKERLQTLLINLVPAASEVVNKQPIPEDVPPLVRDVLEQKRTLGSQSTFIYGLVDLPGKRIWLAWMGDSRLRLWDNQGKEVSSLLGTTFHTSERWSTTRGPLGELHTTTLSTSQISCLTVYSDGLTSLDAAPAAFLSDHAVQEQIILSGEAPTSDDISVLTLWLRATAPEARPLPAPRLSIRKENKLVWSAVGNATQYEVYSADLIPQRKYLKVKEWEIPSDWLPTQQAVFKVRAWQGWEPGAWSKSVAARIPQLPLSHLPTPSKIPPITPYPQEQAKAPVIFNGAPPPPPRRRMLPWLIACGVLLVLLVLAVLFLPGLNQPAPTQTPTLTANQIPPATPTLPPTQSITPGTETPPSATKQLTHTPPSRTFTPTLENSATLTQTPSLTPSPISK
jgi:hypothetical protein